MGEHALLNPSGAKQRRLCPGSLAMQAFAGTPEKPSEYAAEGTAAHELGDLCLKQGVDAAHFLGMVIKADGFTFTVDADMARDVQVYLDAVREYAGDYPIFSEVRLHHGEMIDMHDDLAWGTSDAVIITADEIQVHDLKYGRGVPVSPVENDQAIAYALGALAYVEGIMGTDDIERVRIVIHQVRSEHPLLEWVVTKHELLTVYAPRLQASEHEAHRLHRLVGNRMYLDPEQFLVPGEEQCRFCKAKTSCPSLRRKVAEEVAGDFEALDEPVAIAQEEVDGGRAGDAEMVRMGSSTANALLAAHLASVPLIRLWCDAIEAEGSRVALAGEEVPGFKVVAGKRGNRAWKDEATAEATLKGMRLKQDEMYSFKLISPTQAEKVLAESPRKWAKVKDLIGQADGKPTLVPASDKRPALVIAPPENDFEDLDTPVEDLC